MATTLDIPCCISHADMEPDILHDDAPPIESLIGGGVSGVVRIEGGHSPQNGYRIELFCPGP